MENPPEPPADDALIDTILIHPLPGVVRSTEQKQRQWQAFLALRRRIPLRAPLPLMGGWAILPDFAGVLAAQIQQHKPEMIVEAGSGVSTIVTAYCLEQQPFGHLISIDHAAEFSEMTRQNLQRHGLADYVELIHAPLKPMDINGETWDWYDVTHISRDMAIDFLVVDGPPQHENRQSMIRYPALPVFFDHLKPGAYILLDDARRDDEQRIVERWLKEFDIHLVADFDTEKGAKLLRKHP